MRRARRRALAVAAAPSTGAPSSLTRPRGRCCGGRARTAPRARGPSACRRRRRWAVRRASMATAACHTRCAASPAARARARRTPVTSAAAAVDQGSSPCVRITASAERASLATVEHLYSWPDSRPTMKLVGSSLEKHSAEPPACIPSPCGVALALALPTLGIGSKKPIAGSPPPPAAPLAPRLHISTLVRVRLGIRVGVGVGVRIRVGVGIRIR
eukprot:scaffold98373_cov75-Phaeocystis_antarctica.AAC.9